MSLLRVTGLAAGYGGHRVVHGIDLTVAAGEVSVIIGPNGAGKSTALKAIAGLIAVYEGKVEVAEQDVTGRTPAVIAHAGAAFVPQERNIFRSLSVADNLAIGAWLRPAEKKRRQAEVLDLFPDLRAKMKVSAGLLSGGQRQMVAVAMALMVEPKLLLLDEPTAGLSPALVGDMLALFQRLAAQTGVASLIVEQNAYEALRHADRGTVLVDGHVARTGVAAELLADKQIGELFLGKAA